ncbi:MAG: hypothetical protein Q9159_001519 [Coniocarpon cinnabarinum]
MTYETVIPKGSLILVTGANGYIGSHVAEQLIIAGYKVRGTSRSEDKARHIAEILEKRNGKGTFEWSVVPDMAVPGAFDAAMKGCAGVAHVATSIFPSPDPNETVPHVVNGTLGIMRSAKAHASIKRFVLTSSSLAAVHPTPNTEFEVTGDSWNEYDPKHAWAPPPYTSDRTLLVYGASKVAGEEAAWKFMKEEKPQFEFNAVLPNFNVGEKLHPMQSSSVASVEGLYKGNERLIEVLRNFTPQYFIDVKDDARLHVAGLTHGDVVNERIFGFAEPWSYQKWVDTWTKIDPSRAGTFPPALNQDQDLSTYPPTKRSVELLRRLGQDGWTSMEDSTRQLLKSMS